MIVVLGGVKKKKKERFQNRREDKICIDVHGIVNNQKLSTQPKKMPVEWQKNIAGVL